MNKEYCIMPISDKPGMEWDNERFVGSHRHEVFGGVANRHKSIEDGLVIFLTPEMHNMSDKGIHFNKEFSDYAKKVAQKRWMEFYNKDKDDFIRRYGRNYL